MARCLVRLINGSNWYYFPCTVGEFAQRWQRAIAANEMITAPDGKDMISPYAVSHAVPAEG
jgi:hypothetical protein